MLIRHGAAAEVGHDVFRELESGFLGLLPAPDLLKQHLHDTGAIAHVHGTVSGPRLPVERAQGRLLIVVHERPDRPVRRDLHLLQRRRVTHGRSAHEGHGRPVALQDSGKAVAEVAGVHHQGLIAGFDEVSGGDVHGQRAGAGDDKGLSAGAQKHLAQPFQRLAEDLD